MITVQGSDLHDIRQQLLCAERTHEITINLRRGIDYGRKAQKGCIIKINGEEVERECHSAEEAIEIVGKHLARIDWKAEHPGEMMQQEG